MPTNESRFRHQMIKMQQHSSGNFNLIQEIVIISNIKVKKQDLEKPTQKCETNPETS